MSTHQNTTKVLSRRAAIYSACAGLLMACSSESSRAVTAKLEVSESGTYKLDGVAVAKEELKFAVRAKRPENGTLLLHVIPSSRASFEAVGHAMQAAQYAGAQVGIVGNERF